MPSTSDTIFRNGNFWTGDVRNPFAGSITSRGGWITATSRGNEPNDTAPGAAVIDLHGLFAMPGFIDAHTHFRSGGASLRQINLRNTRSEAEFSDSVRRYAASQPHGKWIMGGSWDNETWQSRKFPTKGLIDQFTRSTPVFLDRYDTHAALVNSAALSIAGISRDTPDPPGGVIVRDETGEPTGIVKDAAREMMLKVVPQASFEDLIEDARAALRHARAFGVTSVNEIGTERDLQAYIQLKSRGELTTRIHHMLPLSHYSQMTGLLSTLDPEDVFLRAGGLKAFADGSLGAGTAWFFAPYEDDPENYGIATASLSSGRIEEWALEADRNRCQLAIHAIGDRAVCAVLDLFGKIREVNPPWERRFRIEHAQHARQDDFSRMKELNVIASVQPYHCIDDGRWAPRKIGPDRARTSFAFRTMIDDGIHIAFGTDWPVAPLNPMEGIYAAVTRATVDGMNPGGWIPEEKISLDLALRAYTYGGAFASFSENIKGTLAPGRLTDFVVLSENPFSVPPERLKDIKVLMTAVGGDIVFADGDFTEYRDGSSV